MTDGNPADQREVGMSKYRFSGRIASYFRSTDNAWATVAVIADGVHAKRRVIVKNEIALLHDSGHLERRGERGKYEYRWSPDTLYREVGS